MKESTMYQRILREGRQEGIQEGLNLGEVKEARRFLLVMATERFGEPDSDILTALGSIESVERLESLGRRMIADPTIGGWEDLLQ